MRRQSKNLSLDPEAIRRGELYSELHQTNISRLVSNFLRSLPMEGEENERPLSPAVRRLVGVGTGDTGADDYHRYLLDKFGR